MKVNKIVSIIVPVYNQEQYLECSISALLKQSYNQLEIIIVDDGSTDCSFEIMSKYSEIDERIKIIRKKNGGLVDATLVGIENSVGDYICFLDPDDYVGDDFIEKFINEMDDNYDFIATGFLKNKQGTFIPYFLKEDRIYNSTELSEFCSDFLFDKTSAIVSNQFFISRWNKIYRRECVLKAYEQFQRCRKISLGEDTIFTYLILSNSKKAKTVKGLNSYYYNISNQNSMMKNAGIESHIEKSLRAFNLFYELLKEDERDISQAYYLYYFLIESIFQRSLINNKSEFIKLYKYIKKDSTYRKTLSIIYDCTVSSKKKYEIMIRKNVFSQLYIIINILFYELKKVYKILSKNVPNFFKDLRKRGIIKAIYQAKFTKNRENAFKDLEKKLPLIEKRVVPLLQSYLDKKTNFNECEIERNIFLFWWDGFNNAPEIVKRCNASVRENYTDCNIIEITKYNYKKYTDINKIIINDFEKGKISIQTFSDILRFNLLKNNGGIWIDSTIFFLQKYDLFESLQEKAFESINFSSTNNFLNYKNQYCSWSGYFIAARKNALIVNVINDIFEKYYVKYRTYSIYFFIDAIFMICKIYKIDDNALGKIKKDENDMFLLNKILNESYDEHTNKLACKIPQKLKWFYTPTNNNYNSFYNNIISDKKYINTKHNEIRD